MKKQSVWSLGNLACHLFFLVYKEYVYFSVSCQPPSDSGGAMHPSVYADGLSGWGMYSPRTSGLSNKYNTQSFVLLEELASAWNYILQLTRVVEGMEGRKEIIHALLSKRNY